jgi:hypothetical protein
MPMFICGGCDIRICVDDPTAPVMCGACRWRQQRRQRRRDELATINRDAERGGERRARPDSATADRDAA